MNAYHYVQCGLDNVWLQNGFDIVETPYGQSVKIERANQLDAVISECLTKKAAPLTGREFRFLRLRLDMSQKRIGELMGKEAQTVAVWEKSEKVNQDVDFMIRHIYLQTVINARQTYVELVDYLNELDRAEHENHLSFKETEDGWEKAA
ncbi:MAG: transcriptional regulator [Candidatus Methylumidiphilus alinenensis]|uniref:Transcriptional regulator n=1 Tax=Candidatus Methylumidiphilus alinenensis TaxID=2202197 RepID=A0A2W4STB9_9GAMM|nr:MAG: transcriptional regulator [Candidatus Methylumidiphilus alinenensis]